MKKDVNLTDEQLEMVRGIVLFAEAFCNQVYHIMTNHGLEKVDGCNVRVSVDPSLDLTTMNITVGVPYSGFGYMTLARGIKEDGYTLFGRNSCTYEELLGQHHDFEKKPQAENAENVPLPEDGFWF